MEDLDSLLDTRAQTEEESVKKAVVLMDYRELHINEEMHEDRGMTLWMKEGQKY